MGDGYNDYDTIASRLAIVRQLLVCGQKESVEDHYSMSKSDFATVVVELQRVITWAEGLANSHRAYSGEDKADG